MDGKLDVLCDILNLLTQIMLLFFDNEHIYGVKLAQLSTVCPPLVIPNFSLMCNLRLRFLKH